MKIKSSKTSQTVKEVRYSPSLHGRSLINSIFQQHSTSTILCVRL